MTLGERIQAHRKQAALSQEKLAEMVDVSRQAVTKWESNQSVPSMENLIKLSGIFNIPLDQLANGNNDESDAQIVQEPVVKRDNARIIINISWLGFILIGAASNGYYQDGFFGGEHTLPILIWTCMGFIGSILLVIRESLYYKRFNRHLVGYDLLYILLVLLIPMIPIRHDLALIAMLVFVILYLVMFYRKIVRSIRPKK